MRAGVDRVLKVKEQAAGDLAEARQRIAELAVVNEIGQTIAYASELDDLLTLVHQQVSGLFNTTSFYIATHEEESDEWMSVLDIERGERQSRARYSVDSGVTGHIIHSRQPVLWRSAEEGRTLLEAQTIEAVGEMALSWLGVPLIAADRVVGVMAVQSYEQEDLYDEHDLAVFSMIGAQVAPALATMQLLEKTRRQAREMAVLNKVGRAFTSSLELDEVLHEVVDVTKAQFDHYFVAIALVEDGRLVLRSGSTIGDSNVRFGAGDLKEIELADGTSFVAEAARTGQMVLVNDVVGDPRYLAVDELPGTRSELCLPIKTRNRVIGVLDVQSDRPSAFSHSGAALLQSVANQAAVALENARLYEAINQELTERTKIEEALRESHEAFKTILDSIDASVYVSDFDTYEILFMNKHITESFGGDFTGQLCHEVFHKSSEPCPYCTNDRLLDAHGEPTGLIAWEGQNPVTGSWYINHNRAIRWTDGRFVRLEIATDITKIKQTEEALQRAYDEVEKRVEERTIELQHATAERERLQQEVIEVQRQALQELSTPIIPVMERIIVMPLVGNIDSVRARDITRSLLAGIRAHRAKVVILDITGVSAVDSGVADHLNKTIQAARLKGARTIVTGISDAVAETIVDLGIDWGSVETLGDLQTGLVVALNSLGVRLSK
jgi:GAF domain-containing protein/anti-anti-sigma regulatory factor